MVNRFTFPAAGGLALRKAVPGHPKYPNEQVTMSAIGNLLWFFSFGLILALQWWLAGLIMFCSVIGIPWAKACFVIGQFALFPFGKEAISRKDLKGNHDIGTGGLGMLGNVVWFFIGGLWLALGHCFAALVCAVTVIGIPFAIQHLKLAGLALAPIGKTIVSKEVAAAARAANAHAFLGQHRGGWPNQQFARVPCGKPEDDCGRCRGWDRNTFSPGFHRHRGFRLQARG